MGKTRQLPGTFRWVYKKILYPSKIFRKLVVNVVNSKRYLTLFAEMEFSNSLFLPALGAVGTLAYALCQHYPEMKITVCDLEPAVSLAHHFRPSVEACPNQANVSFAVGDFFKPETIPKADLYVLSHVLHDWSEDKVDLILSNVYKCLPSGNFSRNNVLPFFKGSSPRTD